MEGTRRDRMRRLPLIVLFAALGSGIRPALAATDPAVENKVTLSLNGARLRQAVETLSQVWGRSVAVDPAISDVPVTLNLQGMAWEKALDFLVRNASAQAPGLYWMREGDD